MTCLPESGGCERQRTDSFVSYLNELENSHFSHDRCLDRIFRNSPQPEALYIETGFAKSLVIERKSVVWPTDYVVLHKNDHFVASLLIEGLRDLTANLPYGIRLEAGASSRGSDLTVFASQIVNSVREGFSGVERGETIGSTISGRKWRFFQEDPSWRKEDGEPEYGLVVRWYSDETRDQVSDPTVKLLADVSRLFDSCVRKFQNYLSARRILLVEQYGGLQYLGKLFWMHLFETLPPPLEISEIWRGGRDWITDLKEDWVFEKLYPTSAHQP